MSVAILLQFAGLAVVLTIGIILVYVIFEMREVHADQRAEFLRAVSAAEDFKHLAEQIQTENRLLQGTVKQVEKAVEDLSSAATAAIASSVRQNAAAAEKLCQHITTQEAQFRDLLGQAVEKVFDSVRGGQLASAERHAAALEDLRKHVDVQDTRLQEIVAALEGVAEDMRTLNKSQMAPLAVQDYSHLRKNALVNDPQHRFALLKDWIFANAMGILRRSAGTWNSPQGLITGMPSSFDAEVEVLDDSILLIGTRDVPERVALPLRKLNPASKFAGWFELGSNGSSAYAEVPAILSLSNGTLELIQKGRAWSAQKT